MSTFTFDLESLKSGPLVQQVQGFESGLMSSTPDDKLTYSGNDPIVWDRTNNERIRRGLDPLPGPRPVDDGRVYGRGATATNTNPNAPPPTPEETAAAKAKAQALANKFGFGKDFANQGAKVFDVECPPGTTREQAFEIFKKQYDTGGLTGFNPGDTLNAQSQAADGLESAKAMVAQMRAGPPGVTTGTLNSFKNIADTTKESIAAGNTGTLQERVANAGGLLQGAGAKIGGLFGTAPANPISTADFATTAAALMPMKGMSTTDVRATVSSVAAGVGQNYDEFSNDKGVGKFGLDATQLESAGLLKPGTASTYLSQGSNDLTTVLKSPSVWTGKSGINNLDALLKSTSVQATTQQESMAKGLGIASALGLPVDKLPAKDQGGMASVFGKDSAGGADWIRGQLPPEIGRAHV